VNVQIQGIIERFGNSIQHPDLAHFLSSSGFDPKLPIPALRKTGVHNIVDADRGIELMFCERVAFQRDHGDPKSDGEGILLSVVIYPNGTKSFKPFGGLLPAPLSGALNRASLIQVLGPGKVTDEEDGQVFSEGWLMDSVAVHADYKPDGALKMLQFSVPLRRE
jgi:hypothetical protein